MDKEDNNRDDGDNNGDGADGPVLPFSGIAEGAAAAPPASPPPDGAPDRGTVGALPFVVESGTERSLRNPHFFP